MKIEKFKVLLYLKKSGTDKSGKAPIMGRITVNRTMAQFGCKLSCRPELWNARESRLDGKSREAVETNAKLDKLLLCFNPLRNGFQLSPQLPRFSPNYLIHRLYCVNLPNFGGFSTDFQ